MIVETIFKCHFKKWNKVCWFYFKISINWRYIKHTYTENTELPNYIIINKFKLGNVTIQYFLSYLWYYTDFSHTPRESMSYKFWKFPYKLNINIVPINIFINNARVRYARCIDEHLFSLILFSHRPLHIVGDDNIIVVEYNMII